MQNEDIINDFCNKFGCELTVVEDGEHFFHMQEQLDMYKKWIDKNF